MVNMHCDRVCMWSADIVPECPCGQVALCQSVYAVNRHCVRLCMWSTGIVLDCACSQQALC